MSIINDLCALATYPPRGPTESADRNRVRRPLIAVELETRLQVWQRAARAKWKEANPSADVTNFEWTPPFVLPGGDGYEANGCLTPEWADVLVVARTLPENADIEEEIEDERRAHMLSVLALRVEAPLLCGLVRNTAAAIRQGVAPKPEAWDSFIDVMVNFYVGKRDIVMAAQFLAFKK